MHKELLLLVLLALAAASWGASFYKWVDEKASPISRNCHLLEGAQEVQKQVNSPALRRRQTIRRPRTGRKRKRSFAGARSTVQRRPGSRRRRESAAKHFQDRCMVARRSLRDIENASAVSTTNDKG
ncbi:MAG: hypothetical protein IPK02_04655 [Candidatus Accumulibacter sp.]|uniref:DUF4124 domain-containing protein n=1 Tax=Candidatus Accumulibacter affinis TaxID=2954384 RepID=A0A935W2R7_9PROT|nr:hypothetical protein [Candidatus Accumulibacter affinis]